MVRVGVPDWAEDEVLARFPQRIELVRIPAEPKDLVEVEFWIPPLYSGAGQKLAPHVRGVRVVQSLLAGVDWLLPLVPDGVTICDGRGVHNVATSEWVVAAILSHLKYFPLYLHIQDRSDWRRRNEADQFYRSMHRIEKTIVPPVLGEELAGKTVLIVGYGSIGESIEQRLAPFQVKFLRMARSARPGVEPVARLNEVLPLADVVVLIVPLTQETTGMIQAEQLALMKRGALLVNAARGPVVNTAALLAELKEGRIRAAIDVTDPEPLPPEHPLWHAPNLIITPHVAASSPMFLPRAFGFAAEQVARYIAGEPLLNVVHGEY